MMRATLGAAWMASIVGAVSLAAVFTTANMMFGIYEVANDHMNAAELPAVFVGGVLMLLLSFLASLLITIPVSGLVVLCAYPLLRRRERIDRKVSCLVGFLIGVLIWLGLFWNGPTGNLYFGSWFSAFAIAGLAGGAGGLAFARHFSEV